MRNVLLLLNRSSILRIMNKLNKEKRSQVIGCLIEGNSINATCRMTGVAKMTVLRLLKDVGIACAEFHDAMVRNLKDARIQCDEVWSFCYAKDRNLPVELRDNPEFGSVWTWIAICSDSKLLASFHVGQRTLGDADVFMRDLRSRLKGHSQITTDGLSAYTSAIINNFPRRSVDYSILIKNYGPSGNSRSPETRYSPGKLLGNREAKYPRRYRRDRDLD